MLRISVFGFSLVLTVGAAAAADDAVMLDGVAAHVNTHVITVGDVLIAMEPARRQMVGRHGGADLRDRLKAEYEDTLQGLIDRFVILDAYEKGDARIPDWALNKRTEEVIRDSFDGDRQALLEALKSEGLTYEDWRRRIQEQMIVASMRSSSVEASATIPPGELQRYYEEHRSSFQSPARAHVRVIAVPRTGTNEAGCAAAEAALVRLRGGEDFAALAREISQGMKAGEGGDWGWVEPGTLRPELAKAIQALAPDGVSDVIQTDRECYVIKLVAREEAQDKSFLEAQEEIEEALRRERAKAAYDEWLGRLRQDAYVQIFTVDLF